MRPGLMLILLSGLFLACALFQFCAIGAEPSADPSGGEPKQHGKCLVYVGTFTGPKSKGIYVFRMDLASGALSPLGLAAETENPAFLDIDSTHHFLFAANEVGHFQGKPTGAVTAFSIDTKTGKLTLLNQRSSGGSGPCQLVTDAAARNVLVANYNSGSVAVLPVRPGGGLDDATAFIQHSGKSINPARQEGPHAHCMTLDAANRFAFACDLGLDKVMIYRFNSQQGTLSANEPAFAAIKPGSGPRHMVFHPNNHQAYVINELNSTMTRLAYDPERGVLTEMQTISTLPGDFKEKNFPAEIAVHPSGAFLYGSNRGHDSIAIYSIDSATGALKSLGFESTRGKTPRNFCIDPTGTYLLAANQKSDNVVVFRIDPESGGLKFTGEITDVPAPACIKFLMVR